MGTLFQDIRYGVRMLLKNPSMTIVATLTLALGIGANTTIFSALNGLLLRPLPVANADRLVVFGGQREGGDPFIHLSYPDFRMCGRRQTGSLIVLAYRLNLAGLDYDNRTEPVIFSYVSGNYFQALGLKPAQGRLIYGEETEKLGAEHVVVLGYSYWKKTFHTPIPVLSASK